MAFNYLLSGGIYLLFIVLMLLAFLTAVIASTVSWIAGVGPGRTFQWSAQQYWKLFLYLSPLIGTVTIRHPEHLNTTVPAIYAVSHQSSMDFVLIGSMIRNFVTISNHPISDFWLFCRIPRLIGVHYMPKETPNASIAVYGRLEAALEQGASVFIFPEGTRNYSPRLKPFQKGAFRLAAESGTPVVPVVIQGTGKIVTKGSNLNRTFRRTDISVTFLEPIVPGPEEKVRDLSARVREVMQTELERNFV